MGSNKTPEVVTLQKRQMYALDATNKIFKERVTAYRETLKIIYPEYFNWELHCVPLRILVSSEMEYERTTRIIENDLDWTIMDIKRRDKAFDRMKWCYEKLGFSMEVMKRLKQAVANLNDKAMSFEEEVANLMDMANLEALA